MLPPSRPPPPPPPPALSRPDATRNRHAPSVPASRTILLDTSPRVPRSTAAGLLGTGGVFLDQRPEPVDGTQHMFGRVTLGHRHPPVQQVSFSPNFSDRAARPGRAITNRHSPDARCLGWDVPCRRSTPQ